MVEKSMNLTQLTAIREAEKASHVEMYSRAELFQKGSWLAKPVKTVLEQLTRLEGKNGQRALDLGCGVGRNSIPIAKTLKCPVDCVDILPMAIEKLEDNAGEYAAAEYINGIVSAIDDYAVQPEHYDLILAISALEHVDSKATFVQKLIEIAAGTKPGGIVCLVINTGVTEQEKVTGREMPPQFEVNFSTVKLIELLKSIFSGWIILKQTVVHQCYEIPRNWGVSVLDTDVVTYVVEKAF